MLISAYQKPTHYRGVPRMDKKITLAQIRSQSYVLSRRCTVNHEESGLLLMRPPRICTHRRMISDRVTKEEHIAGLMRCVEWEARHSRSASLTAIRGVAAVHSVHPGVAYGTTYNGGRSSDRHRAKHPCLRPRKRHASMHQSDVELRVSRHRRRETKRRVYARV